MKGFRCSTWIGLLWSIVVGTLLHFLYGWSGENRVVGLYSAISESTWEHLKLLFFPVLVYTIWEYIWIGHRWKGYAMARAEAVLLGMLTIVTLFYTYTGIFGRHWLSADILTFVIGAGVTAWYSWRRAPKRQGRDIIGVLIFALLAVCFGVFSLIPPQWGMFLAPT